MPTLNDVVFLLRRPGETLTRSTPAIREKHHGLSPLPAWPSGPRVASARRLVNAAVGHSHAIVHSVTASRQQQQRRRHFITHYTASSRIYGCIVSNESTCDNQLCCIHSVMVYCWTTMAEPDDLCRRHDMELSSADGKQLPLWCRLLFEVT